MNLRQYIKKVEGWIQQGRLTLPKGALVIVLENAKGIFDIKIEFTDQDTEPTVRAASITV
jgi:hypothetical protein